jgi:hypothetical protein
LIPDGDGMLGSLEPGEYREPYRRYVDLERHVLVLRANGLLAYLLEEPLPGETQEDLDRMAAEDERLAREGLVRLAGENGELSYKHVDELSLEDVPARKRAEEALLDLLMARNDQLLDLPVLKRWAER